MLLKLYIELYITIDNLPIIFINNNNKIKYQIVVNNLTKQILLTKFQNQQQDKVL